jgi:acetyl esterase/lipase
MKTLMILFFVIIVAFNPNYGLAQQYAVLTGKTNILWEHEMKLGNLTVPLSDNGGFNYRLPLSNAASYTLSHQNRKVELFLSPGDSLNIDLTEQEIVIHGTSEKLNTSLQEYVRKVLNNSMYLDNNNKMVFSLSLPAFNQKIDSLKDIDEKLLEEFLRINEKLDNQFETKLKNEIIYRNKFYKLLYPHNFNRHTHKMPQVRSDYFTAITKGSFNQPELLSSTIFVRFVNLYLDIQALGKYKFQNMNTSPVEKVNSRYQAITDLLANQKIKDFFYYQHFQKAIEEYSAKDLTKSFNLFEKDCKDEAIKIQVRALYNKSFEQRKIPSEIRIYKQLGSVGLEAYIFNPKDFNKTDRRSACIFFHGGSWATGMPEWGYENCLRYAGKGMVAISIEYRLQNVHGVYISDAVTDALAAVSWVRQHFTALGIDPDKIVVAGFSSGAHLAACAAMISKGNKSTYFGDDQKFSSQPNAVILQSAPYTVENRGAISPTIPINAYSPMNYVDNGLVPMLLLHGEFDDIVNYSEFEKFVEKMKQTNNKFEYKSFKSGHFFYDPDIIQMVNKLSDDFLLTYGFINKN